MKKYVAEKISGGTMYAPFCRTLAVDMSEWDADFANMQALGFNCVHGFAEWHEIEYEKGKFDFSRIDTMIECAAKHQITAIINIATQNSIGYYSPRWLMEECDGGEYVDSFGQSVRNNLFTVPCLDHPVYKKYADRFLCALGEHFAGDRRIGGYVLWGEPHLFSAGLEGSICFCEHTQAKFRSWLRQKYKNIGKLNVEWGTEGPADFRSFEEIKAPRGYSRQLGGYASWADWRSFMCDDFCFHIRNADKILKDCGADQPTIIEMNFNFGAADQCDQWKIASCADIVGMSSFQRPGREAAYAMWKADSIAKAQDKSVFVVEVLGGNKTFIPGPHTPTEDEIRSNFLQRVGNGAAGVMYWLYRPRLSDTEGGDFGMVRRNGKLTRRAVAGGEISGQCARISERYLNSSRRSSVAVYTSSQIHNFIFGDYVIDEYVDAVKGAIYMLADLHVNADFINEDTLHLLKNYKVLVLPFAYVLSEKAAAAIRAFVKEGGTVVADYIVAFKRENGVCYRDLAEAGLEDVFGVEDVDPYVEDRQIPNAFGIVKGSRMAELYLTSAQTKETYRGRPVLTFNCFGKGKGWYFADLFFASYGRHADKEQREIFYQILNDCGLYAEGTFLAEDQKRQGGLLLSVLHSEKGGAIYTVLNEAEETIEDMLEIPDGKYIDLYGNSVQGTQRCGKLRIPVKLGPLQSTVLFSEMIS